MKKDKRQKRSSKRELLKLNWFWCVAVATHRTLIIQQIKLVISMFCIFVLFYYI